MSLAIFNAIFEKLVVAYFFGPPCICRHKDYSRVYRLTEKLSLYASNNTRDPQICTALGADWARWQPALARWAGWSAGQVGRHVKC